MSHVEHAIDQALPVSVPLMTVPAFAMAIGLDLSVLKAQVGRGYWPTVKVGKRIFINVEGVRVLAAKKVSEFVA